MPNENKTIKRIFYDSLNKITLKKSVSICFLDFNIIVNIL